MGFRRKGLRMMCLQSVVGCRFRGGYQCLGMAGVLCNVWMAPQGGHTVMRCQEYVAPRQGGLSWLCHGWCRMHYQTARPVMRSHGSHWGLSAPSCSYNYATVILRLQLKLQQDADTHEQSVMRSRISVYSRIPFIEPLCVP